MKTTISIEVEVDYKMISKGFPEQGPTYSCGGTPAEPPEYEITSVKFMSLELRDLLDPSIIDGLLDEAAGDDDGNSVPE